jgi:hypothetical protein
VRQADPNRFRTALFAGARRNDLFALYAFHVEISRAPVVVSEPMLGKIRLQWWREVIDQCFGDSPIRVHPVAAVLGDIIRRCDLPRSPFDTMIDAHELNTDGEPFEDLAGLEDWCLKTAGGLQALAARILGIEMDETARLVGAGYMLAGIEYSTAGGVSSDQLVNTAHDRADVLIAAARRHRVPRAVLPALMIASLAQNDIQGGIGTQAHLLWNGLRGRF